MRVGSIVECVEVSNMGNHTIIGGFDVPEFHAPYEVLGFTDCGGVLIKGLNSGISRLDGTEVGYKINRFREIQFPPSLEAEIQECLTREFEWK